MLTTKLRYKRSDVSFEGRSSRSLGSEWAY
jgi:hypothetical protein